MTDKNGGFNSLGLSKTVLQAVRDMGYKIPTPVQEQAIPLILQGDDIVAAAKTGTGKTAAFSLPVLDRLVRSTRKRAPLVLVITPTRELAQQIGDVCIGIARFTKHRVAVVVGGLSYLPQKSALNRGVDVLIATPGRLIDLMEQNAVELDGVTTLVLDEADRMLDMGFWPFVKKIVAATPATRQTLLFSATIDRSITASIKDIMKQPKFVEIAHKGETADTVDQYIIPTTQQLKAGLLNALLKERPAAKVIVFARTRSRADSTSRRLRRAGFSAEAIHSDRSQQQRERALSNFSKGKTNILTATDVLARGIDVSEVDYVVNFDLPNQPEDYIHRIGRTGRAGERGLAISFVSSEQKAWLTDIEKLTKQKIPTFSLKTYNAQAAAKDIIHRENERSAAKDPELAAAAKEHAKRTVRKKGRGSKTQGIKAQGIKASLGKQRPAKSVKKQSTPQIPQAQQAQGASPGKQEQNSRLGYKSGRRTKTSSPQSDMRPGRAQRAGRRKSSR